LEDTCTHEGLQELAGGQQACQGDRADRQ